MTATQATDDRLELLDGLVYADVFDCALTLEEMCCWSRTRISRAALRRRLNDDPGVRAVVAERERLWCLSDRVELPRARAPRTERALRLQRRAQLLAGCVRHVPFVRGLMLTGSLAADDALAEADLDVLVIVAPGRLGLVFLLLAPAARLTRRRLLCPNYYVAQDRLALAAGSVYLAREIAQARALVGDPRALRDANPWVDDVFPNARHEIAPARPRPAGSRVQRMLEALLSGAVGDRLERSAVRVAHARLVHHHSRFGETPPAEVKRLLTTGSSLRFHDSTVGETILARYTRRRDEVRARLRAADSVTEAV